MEKTETKAKLTRTNGVLKSKHLNEYLISKDKNASIVLFCPIQ